MTKRLLLVGGGHAHLSVLQALACSNPADVEVVLVTPSLFQNYSGMLPGWMAGHYALAQSQIDLRPLIGMANAKLIRDHIIGMDADRNCVCLSDGRHIEYDFLSLDVGSEIDVSWLEAASERLLPVKPLDDFFEAWPRILLDSQAKPDYRLVVVGGGAAGVEVTLAAKYAFARAGVSARVDLVVSESGMLVGHAASVQQRIARAMDRAKILVHHQRGVGAEEGVLLADGTMLLADCVIAATGARAPHWLATSKLSLNESQYVAVDAHQRSISHGNVFAAGDVCARQDITVPRSGVHAVYSGPVLAENLLATMQGGPLQSYLPRSHTLYLLACGSRYAVASWGQWSMEGAWVWRWKDWIDRRFVERFSHPKPCAKK